jgi:hypothetical protein
LTTV